MRDQCIHLIIYTWCTEKKLIIKAQKPRRKKTTQKCVACVQFNYIVSYWWCFVGRLPYLFFLEKEPCVQFKRVYLFCGCRCRCCCCCCTFARDIRLCVAHSTLNSILFYAMCVCASHMNVWHTQWHKNFRAHTHIARTLILAQSSRRTHKCAFDCRFQCNRNTDLTHTLTTWLPCLCQFGLSPFYTNKVERNILWWGPCDKQARTLSRHWCCCCRCCCCSLTLTTALTAATTNETEKRNMI